MARKICKVFSKTSYFIIYQKIIENHFIPILGEYELDEIKYETLQNFIIEKIEYGNLKTNGKLSSNTIFLISSILKQSFKQALLLKLITDNPTLYLKYPSLTEKEVNALSRKEQQIIENYCLNSTKNNYLGIIICLYTGIRIGELLALTWDDIDFSNQFMRINKTTYFMNGKTYVDSPKTKSSNRVIPLSKRMIAILKQMKKTCHSKYLIATKTDAMVSIRSYQRTFESILNKCNIKKYNFHTLRHTFATRAIELGMDVKTLSEILGHKNPTITLNRYSHSLIEYKIEMVNKMSLLLQN